MNITKELAQRMIEEIECFQHFGCGTAEMLKAKRVTFIGYFLPNRRQWWKEYGDKAKSLGIRGPNPLEAAKVLTPELLEPTYAYLPDAPDAPDEQIKALKMEALQEAKSRGMLGPGVKIEKSHWLRKIASGEMPPENNL